jgi:hypothetical protein
MNLDAQSALRKSLDDVTRLQRRHKVVLIVLCFCVVTNVLWLGRVSESHPIDTQKMVVAAICFVPLSMLYVGMMVTVFVTRMTKKVLKAIELATKS